MNTREARKTGLPVSVMLAQASIQSLNTDLDSGLRRNDVH